MEEKSNQDLVTEAGAGAYGSVSGLRSQKAQAELTKRLIEKMSDLDQSTTKYSLALVRLTIFMAVVAVFQAILTIMQLAH